MNSTAGAQNATSASSKQLIYRIRNVPEIFNSEQLVRALSKLFGIDVEDVEIKSLAFGYEEINGTRPKTATVCFSSLPDLLATLPEQRWNFNIQHEDLQNHYRVYIDTHFRGFTPLSPCENDALATIDCFLIHGWGSHAIAAYCSPDDGFCWPRDDLGTRFQQLRIWTYGYPSRLTNPNAVEDVFSYADDFRRALHSIKNVEKVESNLPSSLFIVHSLGGWLLVDAMIRMSKSENADDDLNLESAKGAIFVGVPNQGMNVEALADMVDGLPSAYTLNLLNKELGWHLRERQVEDFNDAIPADFEIIQFFEQLKTPTKRWDTTSQKWQLTGKTALLVDPTSASYLRHGRLAYETKIPLLKHHNNMLKFSEGEIDQYSKIYGQIGKLIKRVEAGYTLSRRHTLETYSQLDLSRRPTSNTGFNEQAYHYHHHRPMHDRGFNRGSLSRATTIQNYVGGNITNIDTIYGGASFS